MSPSERVLLDAAELREALAVEWLSASQASARLDSQLSTDGHSASQLRRDGQLLGVYIEHPASGYRYPTWQFRPDGGPVSRLTEILAVLRDSHVFQRESDGLRRTTGWGEVEWFLSPHVLLEGATPAALLAVDPERVLRAASTEFDSTA